MKKHLLFSLSKVFFIGLILMSPASAFAQFDVDWGVSNDTGNAGFDDLGKWFFDNGYAASQAAGANFAKNNYIGKSAPDNDPFYFAPGQYSFKIVQQIAGNADLTSFGFYTGAGLGKSLTQVLASGETGPKNQAISSAFGLFMNAPNSWRNKNTTNWFTDRAENDAKQTGGSDVNAGGDPQALIYKLNSEEYLVAWEDIDYTNIASGQSDRDFNDAYLKVTVTPEPVSMALFGLGGAALGLNGLRKRRKK